MVIAIGVFSICFASIVLTHDIQAKQPQPITQIMTDTGLIFPDVNGTITIHGQGLTKVTPNPIKWA